MAKHQGHHKVAVIGGAGYAGGELLRLLAQHPCVELGMAVSESHSGKKLAEAFPGLRTPIVFERFDAARIIGECSLAFFAQESGFAMEHAEQLLAAGVKIVDLSADFRLRDPAVFQQWYKIEHRCPGLLERAVYGLPELHRDRISTAQLVANHGCYPTASVLALAPLLETRMIIPDSIVIDAKSGVSGAGRAKHTLDYHFPEMNESVRAYGVGGTHRHTPEIEQQASEIWESSITLSFTPHLMPMTRGLLATVYAKLVSPRTTAELIALYAARYNGEPFIVLHDEGFPATKVCCGANHCHIGIAVDDRTQRVTVVSVIDNLVKGAAGQAIQNMNLMLGLPETSGLEHGALWP